MFLITHLFKKNKTKKLIKPQKMSWHYWLQTESKSDIVLLLSARPFRDLDSQSPASI